MYLVIGLCALVVSVAAVCWAALVLSWPWWLSDRLYGLRARVRAVVRELERRSAARASRGGESHE